MLMKQLHIFTSVHHKWVKRFAFSLSFTFGFAVFMLLKCTGGIMASKHRAIRGAVARGTISDDSDFIA